MKKIGLVNIDTSHPFSWAQKMADTPGLDMQYSMLFSDGFRGDDEVNWFINKYNMEGRAESIDELAEKTDIGFVQSCNWDKHVEQALPFINRGKPVLLDKPLVGSVKDIKRIRELIANGANIIGSSSARYAAEIQEFLAQPVEERGEVVTVYGESGVDEFNYGVHIGEILSEIAGAPAVSCRFTGTTERAGGKCELYTVRFANGVIGTYCTYLSGWRPFNVSIMTTKSSLCFKIDSSKIYMALLTRVSEMLKTGEQKTADIERILNVSEFMLCGKRSRDFENGREVRIEELQDDDAFDGYAFEKAYGAAASVMYKD
ncbi:MAG: Gfo/Idh/MocA family oxidoreductase [Oscillospiraceae bacterium]|nr:Gfo/Idh/MocA family oxidoreductase [Oscillospiraceae bacterium]